MKLAQFQKYLHQNAIDLALFIHPDPHLTYFTRISPSYGYLAITTKRATLFLSKLDSSPKLPGITIKPLVSDWYKDLKPNTIQKIGVNKQTLTLAQADRLKKIFPKANLVDAGSTLTELRKIKTKEEMEAITKACEITSRALTALLPELRQHKFRTERDVAFFLEKYIREHGGEIAFPTIVASGKNAAVPHHVPTTEKLQKGFLVLDFGAKWKHYCADMTRTIFLGSPTMEEKETYNLLFQAQQESLNAVKEGVLFMGLDSIARKRLGNYSKQFIHSLGHGIGLEVHEAPTFSDKKEEIQKNCPFTIEPGIYSPGKFGMRIEDTLIFDGEIRILTTFPKELTIIN